MFLIMYGVFIARVRASDCVLCVFGTLARVTPKGLGRWGLLVAKMPFRSLSMGGVI